MFQVDIDLMLIWYDVVFDRDGGYELDLIWIFSSWYICWTWVVLQAAMIVELELFYKLTWMWNLSCFTSWYDCETWFVLQVDMNVKLELCYWLIWKWIDMMWNLIRFSKFQVLVWIGFWYLCFWWGNWYWTCFAVWHECIGVVQSRERFLRSWSLIPWLTHADRDIIERCGLSSLLEMPRFIVNRGLLTTLAEMWHSDTNTFHLATGEITVTLEDCYQILWIPVVGALLPYEQTEEGGTEALRRIL